MATQAPQMLDPISRTIALLNHYKDKLNTYRTKALTDIPPSDHRVQFLNSITLIERSINASLDRLNSRFRFRHPSAHTINDLGQRVNSAGVSFLALSHQTEESVRLIEINMRNLPRTYDQLPDLPIPASPTSATYMGSPAVTAVPSAFVAAGYTMANPPAQYAGNTTFTQNLVRGDRALPWQSTPNLNYLNNPQGNLNQQAGPSNQLMPMQLHHYPSFQEIQHWGDYDPRYYQEQSGVHHEYSPSINSQHSSENSTTGLVKRQSRS